MSTYFFKLQRKIAERGLSLGEVAEAIGITANSMTNKLNHRTEFNWSEIARMIILLEVEDSEVGNIFFADEVLKNYDNGIN